MTWSDRVPLALRKALKPARPVARAVRLWSDAGGMTMSAAVSFYGILSLAPLLLVVVALLGWWMDREVLEKGILSQLGTIIGERGTGVIADTLASARAPSESIMASIAGFIVLLFGATGVFGELQDAFARIWATGQPGHGRQTWRHTATLRLRGIGYVLVVGFLLLVSLVVSTLLNMFSGWLGQGLPLETLFRVLNEMLAFAVCTGLFIGLMRMSAGPKPRMRYLLIGGFAAGILFTLGRQLLSIYLSTAAVVSAYGAAGSLIVLLMWLYFSCAVLLLGAGFARAVEEGQLAPSTPGSPDSGERLALRTP
ncbi:YihY/virulence factor BrkB family protein [Caenimonas sedimenti]|uniref:YihY/virulence factor BrkB family protein n=1 Tax=Caenimonas sedimenti TaxID=2596921 RepID=A0A562ZRK4_9BURK|nr:YihY/virulence factor BrkB family protein [Caenimonas sedimenti]TWO71017.1 YihY/virulence factor BrkB family protein [Caenimonas sedimenti]